MGGLHDVECPCCGSAMTARVFSDAITWMAGCAYYECGNCGTQISKRGVTSHEELVRLINGIGDLEVRGYHVAAVGCPICGEMLHLSWEPGDEFKTVRCERCDSEWCMRWLQDKAIEADEKKENGLCSDG